MSLPLRPLYYHQTLFPTKLCKRCSLHLSKETPQMDYNRGMQFRFSLRSMLICVSALAAACTISASVPARTTEIYLEPGLFGGLPAGEVREVLAQPTLAQFAFRLAWAAPLTIALSLIALWTLRRLMAACNSRMSARTAGQE